MLTSTYHLGLPILLSTFVILMVIIIMNGVSPNLYPPSIIKHCKSQLRGEDNKFKWDIIRGLSWRAIMSQSRHQAGASLCVWECAWLAMSRSGHYVIFFLACLFSPLRHLQETLRPTLTHILDINGSLHSSTDWDQRQPVPQDSLLLVCVTWERQAHSSGSLGTSSGQAEARDPLFITQPSSA